MVLFKFLNHVLVQFLLMQEVEIVLTAHPTQINRRTLQYKHIRIAVRHFELNIFEIWKIFLLKYCVNVVSWYESLIFDSICWIIMIGQILVMKIVKC